MDDRKELSEILLGDKRSSSNGKRAVFVVIIAVVVFVVTAFMVWRFFISNQERLSKPSDLVDTSTMKPLDPIDENFGGGFIGLDSQSLDVSQIPDINFGIDNGTSNQKSEDDIEIDDALNNIESIINPKPTKPEQVESKAKPKNPQTQKVATKPESKPAPAAKPKDAQAKPKSESKSAQAKLESKPAQAKPSTPTTASASNQSAQAQPKPTTNTPNAANGSAPTKGFYWQVGSFTKEPNSDFLASVKKYSYRIQHAQSNERQITRYLLGPYKSRSDAPSREEIVEAFKENPTPVEIQ